MVWRDERNLVGLDTPPGPLMICRMTEFETFLKQKCTAGRMSCLGPMILLV